MAEILDVNSLHGRTLGMYLKYVLYIPRYFGHPIYFEVHGIYLLDR